MCPSKVNLKHAFIHTSPSGVNSAQVTPPGSCTATAKRIGVAEGCISRHKSLRHKVQWVNSSGSSNRFKWITAKLPSYNNSLDCMLPAYLIMNFLQGFCCVTNFLKRISVGYFAYWLFVIQILNWAWFCRRFFLPTVANFLLKWGSLVAGIFIYPNSQLSTLLVLYSIYFFQT